MRFERCHTVAVANSPTMPMTAMIIVDSDTGEMVSVISDQLMRVNV